MTIRTFDSFIASLLAALFSPHTFQFTFQIRILGLLLSILAYPPGEVGHIGPPLGPNLHLVHLSQKLIMNIGITKSTGRRSAGAGSRLQLMDHRHNNTGFASKFQATAISTASVSCTTIAASALASFLLLGRVAALITAMAYSGRSSTYIST